MLYHLAFLTSGVILHELTFGVSITERGLPHVAESDGALARGVNEEVAFARMELAGSDHLGGQKSLGSYFLDTSDA